MTLLSVIVAAAPGLGDPDRCASALLGELDPADEIVWVGSSPPPPGIAFAIPPAAGGRAGLYRAGLDRASHQLVAFTDTATLVQPGWRRAVGSALAAGAAAVGGPVLPERLQALRSFAGFTVEYGPHAAPPFSSASGDVAANNVAYDRRALDELLDQGEPMWKAVVDARLITSGRAPVIDDRMCVLSIKRYTWTDLVLGRAKHGRLYGAQQASAMSVPRRAFRGACCAALPFAAYGRLYRRLVVCQELRRRFALATPIVLMALTAWSVGEAAGFCTATGDPDDII